MPSTKRNNYDNLLFFVNAGDIQQVSMYLKKTAEALKGGNPVFEKALLAAVERRNLEIVKMFFSAGIEKGYGNRIGAIALSKASEMDYGEIILSLNPQLCWGERRKQ